MSPPKPKPDDSDALRARALGLLARRELARRARFLAQRGFAAEAIRGLLTDLDEA